MKFLLISVLSLVSITSVSAQDLLLNKPDSIFRYEVFLDEPIAIDRINAIQIDFPCAEKLLITEQESDGQVMLTSKAGLTERYGRKESGLEIIGYNLRDPFLGLRYKEITFLTPVGYGAFNKKSNDEGESVFLISYSVSELPAEVAELDILKDVKSIQIEGVLSWNCQYIGETRFFNITRFKEGTFFQNDHVFEVSSIKLRKKTWRILEKNEGRKLRDFFKTSRLSFRNFFTESDALERVRITDFPYLSLAINLPEENLNLSECEARSGKIKVYPNPTYGNLNLLFESSQRGRYKFGIYNIIGKKLWETEVEVDRTPFKVALNTPQLSKGVYLYAITSPDGERIQSRRLVLVEP